jgi:hypothetical protein
LKISSKSLKKPLFLIKKPQNRSKRLTILEKASILLGKASHHFKKALIPVKMILKSIAIFEKPSH